MSLQEKPVIGVVGLGSMGLGMAQTLAAKGFATLGFDLSAERKVLAEKAGVTPSDTLDLLFEKSNFLVFSCQRHAMLKTSSMRIVICWQVPIAVA